MTETENFRLVVRRFIAANPERLFEAWTTPSELISWWGPRGVRCIHAEMDLRVGGRFRICNEVTDCRVVVISGEFLTVDPPRELAYTWSLEPESELFERVNVHFYARQAGTEIVIIHEKIQSERVKQEHAEGWNGCLDGLAAFVRPSHVPAASDP